MSTLNSSNIIPLSHRRKSKRDVLAERIESKLAQFNELKSLDENIKQNNLSQIRIYQIELTNLYVLNKTIDRTIRILLFIWLFVVLFISPILYPFKNNLDLKSENMFFIFLSQGVLFFLLTGLALLPSLLKNKSALIDFCWIIMLTIGCIIGIDRISFISINQVAFIVLGNGFLLAMFAESIFWVGVYFFAVLLVIVKMIISLWRMTHYPVAVVVDNLILILSEEEKHPGNRIELKYKQLQISRLEEAARSVEFYLPQKLHCGDAITHLWLKKVSQQIATALREKKRWILTPKEDTYDYLVTSIAHTLTNVLNGNWDALDKIDLEALIEAEKLTRPQVWRSRIVSILRTIFVALLPIGVFLGIQYSPIAIPNTFSYPVIFGLVIWAMLVLAVQFDPDLSSKISTFKDITSILSSSGTSKKP